MFVPDKALWQSVSPLLDQALDLAPADRPAFLAALSDRSGELARLVADLLDQHEALIASNYMETAPPEVVSGPSLAGRQVGAYTLEIPLGVGGMGAVWKARRSDGRFDGHVAIKLLNVAMLDDAGCRRFQREGSILARLAHPHIARLLDAGVWITGQPYLVIEYVEGEPIDRAADARGLTVEARLDLFLQVADAVSHAHARLVVHRDLKPSNVLLSASGQVMLLDFGIASLLEDAGRDGMTLGRAALTPEFAAPEQVDGLPVATTTDVYALGVLLYRLLTGRHPTGEGCTTPAQFTRALGEVEPPPASRAAVTGDAASVGRRASQRATSPERLATRLRGDLDTILATALQKDPARRYPSAAAMADDVRRHLGHEPVHARQASWRYRAGRFVRRHRVASVATLVVATALVTVSAIALRQGREAQRQRDVAVESQRRAEASSEFLSFLVSQIGNRPMTMREVLDQARGALEQQYRAEPETVARMLMQLSGRYMELNDAAAVRGTLSRALEMAQAAKSPDLLAAINCDLAEWHADQGDVATARQVFARAQDALGSLAAPTTGLRVECLLTEQTILEADGQPEAALAAARAAVDLLEAAGNTSSTRYTSALNSLTMTLDTLGRHRESLTAQARVVETLERIGRGRTSAMAVSLHNLAYTQVDLGRWRDAVATYARVIDIVRGFDGGDSVPAVHAIAHGRMLLLVGRDDEAAAWLERGLGMVTEPGAPLRLRAQVGLLEVFLRRRDAAAARRLADELTLAVAALPPASRRDIDLRLAQLSLLERDPNAARTRVDALLAAQRVGTTSAGVGAYQVVAPAAAVVLDAGDAVEAARLAREAIVLAERSCGVDPPSAHVGIAHLVLARALEAQGRRDEAAPHAVTAADHLTRSAGDGHPLARQALALAGR